MNYALINSYRVIGGFYVKVTRVFTESRMKGKGKKKVLMYLSFSVNPTAEALEPCITRRSHAIYTVFCMHSLLLPGRTLSLHACVEAIIQTGK